jgi:hypothetical protein
MFLASSSGPAKEVIKEGPISGPKHPLKQHHTGKRRISEMLERIIRKLCIQHDRWCFLKLPMI